LDAVLAEYGIEIEDFGRWGGSVTYADRQLNFMHEGPERKDRVSAMRDGELDAVFDEGLMSRSWTQIADAVDLTFLPVDDTVLSALEDRFGAQRAVIPKGRLRGVEQDTPTVDFAGWLLLCRTDLPDELVYLTLVALEEQKGQIESLFEGQRPHAGLSDLPFDISKVGIGTGVPLHSGAVRFLSERGFV
jgi:TRAP-type uncharacterized transport system substrate-binding protein